MNLEEKLELQKRVKELEAERNQARRLFDAQDKIDAKRDEIIKGIEEELVAQESYETLIRIRWRLN